MGVDTFCSGVVKPSYTTDQLVLIAVRLLPLNCEDYPFFFHYLFLAGYVQYWYIGNANKTVVFPLSAVFSDS